MIFVAALILLAGMSVIIIALAHEVVLDLRMTRNLVDADQATEIAKVGLDNIIYLANTDAAWRTTYFSGPWIFYKSVGGGSFMASGVDYDDDLADCPIDTVLAMCTATYNGTRRSLSATLTPPVHASMMYLAYASGGGAAVRIVNTPRIYGDICSGDRVTLSGAAPDFRGDIYVTVAERVAAGLDDGDTDIIAIQSNPTQPVVDFNWLTSRASVISPPHVDGDYQITDRRIAEDENPYGFTNSNAIYHIDARGDGVKFTRSYIHATIIITNAATVTFDKACVHYPKETYYPTLVVDGRVVYSFDQNLSESESGTDFNHDADQADTFTPSVTGVVYATKSITGLQASGGTNIVRFKGALVSTQVVLIGPGCIFEQDAGLSTNLVNQFQGKGLRLVKGTMTIQ